MKKQYSLSPTQEGMLYHFLSRPGTGVDIQQIVCVLSEKVDVPKLEQAWQMTIDENEVLRTIFDWSTSTPLQIVKDYWHVRFGYEDWREYDVDTREKKLKEFLLEDRKKGFDLGELPLMRFKLLAFGDSDYRLIWSFHHAILDGRSFTLLLKEVFGLYDTFFKGERGQCISRTPFVEYIEWLESSKDESASKIFWQKYLTGFSTPNPLVVDTIGEASAGSLESHGVVERELPCDTLESLEKLARNCGVTLNTLIQGAWTLLLSRYSGEYDIVFGATRACRHIPIGDPNNMLGTFINTLPVRIAFKPDKKVREFLSELRKQFVAIRPFEHSPLSHVQTWSELPRQTAMFETLVVFEKYDFSSFLQEQGGPWSNRKFELYEQTNYPVTFYGYAGSNLKLKLSFNQSRLDEATALRMLNHVCMLLGEMAGNLDGEKEVGALRMLTEEEEEQLLLTWNHTATDFPSDRCVHQLFESQVDKSPNAIAMVCRNQEISYRELNERANQLARHLVKIGVKNDVLVGISVERTVDMVVGLMGILKAGGAYVPLDPKFPRERLTLMMEDSGAPVLVTQQKLVSLFPEHSAKVICLDSDWSTIAVESKDPVESGVSPENLAYVIYTSGSTGRPKGVMVEHRNVVNFFVGMDQQIAFNEGSTFLAVTSLSFDISVLEIFWTLARGFKTVIYPGAEFDDKPDAAGGGDKRPMDFSFFYFSADQGEVPENKYRLLLEGTKYADENGFCAVWTPERHFHEFGGLYPNPSVTGAALAVMTKNVKIRAGSVVAPLHSPVRIAEEWSVVDNLSGGRAGLAFASGWMPEDFVIKPENYVERKNKMFESIEQVRKLWRGESVALPGPLGDDVAVKTLPRPVQKELPVWVTTAGNPETYEMAAKAGANVLTHLLGQTIEEVAEKVVLYRKTWKEAGHPGRGHVSLMLHTFVNNDSGFVKETVREPMLEYLRSSANLIKKYAWSFPVFKRLGQSAQDVSFGDLNNEEMDALLDHAFERYFETSGLFGTRENCVKIVNRLKEHDIDEIACLLDFGISTNVVLENLHHLNAVRQATFQPVIESDGETIPGLVKRHEITHFQCTPSMASMLLVDTSARDALANLDYWLIGGEAFPMSLAREVKSFLKGTIINMYGPTETTIWSTTHVLNNEARIIPIGRPIANTEIYILDEKQRPVPIGIPGELMIGGAGVVRGYHKRPGLTAERFVEYVPQNGSRLKKRVYRTGDLARYLPDGRIEFLGRMDYQVKIRGYRIELGEIEERLCEHPGIREAVVIARDDSPGEKRLVAYFISSNGKPIGSTDLRSHLKNHLPDYMVPSLFVSMDSFPKTPNRKIDRKAFPAPAVVEVEADVPFEAPASEVEEKVAEIWKGFLGVARVGRKDNFFELGANSLTVVRAAARLNELFPKKVSVVDLFQHSNIQRLTEFLTDDWQKNGSETIKQNGRNRGRDRRALLAMRKR